MTIIINQMLHSGIFPNALKVSKVIPQYGFRKNHSTELASLHLVDYIYYTMDANEIPLNVYCVY